MLKWIVALVIAVGVAWWWKGPLGAASLIGPSAILLLLAGRFAPAIPRAADEAMPEDRIGSWALMAVIAVAGIILLPVPWVLPIAPLQLPLFALGMALLVLAGLVWRHHRIGSERIGNLTGIGGVVLLLTMGLTAWSFLGSHRLDANLAEAIETVHLETPPLLGYDYPVDGLAERLHAGNRGQIDSDEQLQQWLLTPSPVLLVCSQSALRSLEPVLSEQVFTVVASSEGLAADLRWMKVTVLAHRAPAASLAPTP